MPTAAPKTRSILIEHYDGSKSLVEDIPANAKITLGPVSMGKADYNNRDIALRIYTTAGNQLAVFRNVNSFRDLSLSLKVQQVTTDTEEHAESGPKGRRRVAKAATTFEWQPVEAF